MNESASLVLSCKFWDKNPPKFGCLAEAEFLEVFQDEDDLLSLF